MARPKIKLTFHKQTRRYRKMYKGRIFESKVVTANTRAEREKAWEEFKLFRSRIDLELEESESAQQKPHRDFYVPAIRDQQRMAEWYAFEGDKEALAKLNARVKDMKKAYAAGEEPPIPDYSLMSQYITGGWVWQDRFRLLDKRRETTEQDLTVEAQMARFLETKKRQAKTGDRSVGRYGKLRNSLRYFSDWHGAKEPIYTVNGQVLQSFYNHLLEQIFEDRIARYTARDHLQVLKQFVDDCCTVIEDYPIPNNARSRQLVIKVKGSNRVVVFEPEELQLLVRNASEKTALYLLMMANTGATQIDLAELHPRQIDWKKGRIIRKRSKTDEFENVPVVNCKLWPATFRLLKKLGMRDGEHVFLGANGHRLVYSDIRDDGLEKRTDCVRSAYNRLVRKLKNAGELPDKFSKSLTDIRNTGSDLINKSKDYRPFQDLYLGHAPQKVSEIHYTTYGEIDPAFDKAVRWLGKQMGLYNIKLPSPAKATAVPKK